jgi:hypothetical protein
MSVAAIAFVAGLSAMQGGAIDRQRAEIHDELPLSFLPPFAPPKDCIAPPKL